MKLIILQNPPFAYPELVPQSGPHEGHYQSREIDFWTSGFFPGCIYTILERLIKYPNSLGSNELPSLRTLRQNFEQAGLTWSDPLQAQSKRSDTHDLGFMIMPHMRPRWESYHDCQALEVIITAAESLASRFDPKLLAIRSWDDMDWHHDVKVTSKDENFLVIIDSMCNMDLLFYAASQSSNKLLADIANKHSRTLLKSHLRAENIVREGYTGNLYSTIHLVNFDPILGSVQSSRTAQGYDANSTWTRGQAWAILGYAQTFSWTGDSDFLDAACGLSEYFLFRMETAPTCVEASGQSVGRYVPLWDFDAPIEDVNRPLRDTSAGVIAANGMLVLFQSLTGMGNHALATRYLKAATRIVKDTLDLALAKEKVRMHVDTSGQLTFHDVESTRFDAILKHATVNNNSSSFRDNKAKDHGLVYADYYLLEFGTQLLRLGLC